MQAMQCDVPQLLAMPELGVQPPQPPWLRGGLRTLDASGLAYLSFTCTLFTIYMALFKVLGSVMLVLSN